MQIMPVSDTNFNGRVIGCSWFKAKQRKAFGQVRPCLEKMLKNKDFDLRFYLSYGRELRLTTSLKPEYTVIESYNPAIWISRAKEIIKDIECKQ